VDKWSERILQQRGHKQTCQQQIMMKRKHSLMNHLLSRSKWNCWTRVASLSLQLWCFGTEYWAGHQRRKCELKINKRKTRKKKKKNQSFVEKLTVFDERFGTNSTWFWVMDIRPTKGGQSQK
jgi:hypothetical protein